MSSPTVILYDLSGYEIASRECISIKVAKQAAKHYLSDLFAETSGTTHKALGTMKVAIFSGVDVKAGRTGANAPCEWDKEYSNAQIESQIAAMEIRDKLQKLFCSKTFVDNLPIDTLRQIQKAVKPYCHS